MAVTASALLDLVNDHIKTRLEGGAVQAYTINGRNLARDNLAQLIKLRDNLKAEVAAGNGGRTFVGFANAQ